MTVPSTLLALAVSLAAIAHLAATDPKRRRVYGLAEPRRRHAGLALAALFLPGPVLLAAGDGAGFVVWLGAITVAGWAVAAVSPRRWAQAVDWQRRVARRIGAGLAAAARRTAATVRMLASVGDTTRRIDQLEERVAALETELARLRRTRPSPVVRESEPPLREASATR